MPRLLILTTVPVTLRGFLLPFAVHFRRLGWRVDAAAAGVSGCPVCVAAFDRVHDLPVSRNPWQPANLLRAARVIEELVQREQYDLVHTHTPVASFVTRFALRRLREFGRPKVIYTAHGFHFHPGGPWLRNTIFSRLEKLAGRWTDWLVVINRDDEQAARRLKIVPAGRLVYMPGIGVDLEQYSPARVSAEEVLRVRSELRLTPADVLFLMIAEFNPGKRHRDVLPALALLPPHAHLALAGTGPQLEPMRQLARELGLAERVHFLGVRSDVPALLRSARATVLPSEREGLPRSVMESLALEVPVIGTDIRGTRDLVGQDCGLLVPVGDPPALAHALRRLLEHPDEAAALGQRGREKMAAFDLGHIMALHEELYQKALAATP